MTKTKTVRMLVFAYNNWQICVQELNKTNDRMMWVRVGSMDFCCYVDEGRPTEALPPKPAK